MILVDTGPLVALCDARDPKHRAALKHLEALAARELATCEAVITEAAFHLPQRSQRLRLHALVRDLAIRPLPSAEPSFWQEVFDWLVKYADHEPDWADVCIAVFSGRDRALKVWTYDREFRTIWRRPNGSSVPLAVRAF